MTTPTRILAILALLASVPSAAADAPWSFAVSGDSRNCGDVVMPAIARDARARGARFYLHLGDFRKTYDFDEDMLAERGGKLTVSEYLAGEWDDFIANQLAPFGDLPVYLGIGNHETIAPKTRAEYLAQFADWLDAPALRAQRLADDPRDHLLKTYYHWRQGGVDFIVLDNATLEQFDEEQLRWLEKVLEADKSAADVKSVVVGMHRALPNSFSCDHSMNESPAEVDSGRRAYRDLLRWRAATGKGVQILASHSHFLLENTYDTPYWRNSRAADRGVLPGWIVGTAGAIRYALPESLPKAGLAKTRTYGYLLAAVAPDGKVTFEYRELAQADVPPDVVKRFGDALVRSCFEGNWEPARKTPPASCFEK
jgi:hypothetical protein